MRFFKKYYHIGSLALWLIFLFTSIVIFGQSLNNFFVSDDFHWLVISRDTVINWQMFLTNYEGSRQGGSYNPLLVLIFKFFYNIFHNNYFAYHLVSIVLHSINGFLVYTLARKIFELASVKHLKKLAILAGFSFLIYPIHVEIISWIAAWPHLWVTSFYLLSLINYFSFRQNNSGKKFIYSLVFFGLALMTKEIAISLPLVVLIWEIYFYSTKNRVKTKGYQLPIYFFILTIFLMLRYIATGLIFGSYSKNNLDFSGLIWTANLSAFFGDWFTFGFLRTIIGKGIYYYLESVVIIVIVSLALYFFIILIKKKYLQFTNFLSILFILGPVLVLGLHRTSFAGERYLYLATAFFVIWIILLIKDLRVNFKINKYILIGLFVLFITINAYKLSIWEEATDLSRQIVGSYQRLDVKDGQKLLSVALPDNLAGAEVFRNNLNQALDIYYPDNHPEILPILAYVVVDKTNKNKQLLKWRQDDRGWFAESVDGGLVVTGITSITMNDVYWELWNYNYQNFKANTIRLLPNADMMDKLKKDELGILVFDRGVLRILE